MYSHIHQIDFDNVVEFWNYIIPGGELSLSRPARPFCFRGQSDASWELIPNVFRSSVIKRYKSDSILSAMNSFSDQAFFEWILLRNFAQLCDSSGYPIPFDSISLRKWLEQDEISNLIGKKTEAWPPADLIPLMALCQHHGVPTRLLDVTTNPLVACYFAASGVLTSEKIPDRLAVYIIDLDVLKFWPSIAKNVFAPGSASVNIAPQSGSFLLVNHHGSRGDDFSADVSMEKIAHSGNFNPPRELMTKITLPGSLAGMLYRTCTLFNVKASVLFPGYDGIARAVLENSQLQRANLVRK